MIVTDGYAVQPPDSHDALNRLKDHMTKDLQGGNLTLIQLLCGTGDEEERLEHEEGWPESGNIADRWEYQSGGFVHTFVKDQGLWSAPHQEPFEWDEIDEDDERGEMESDIIICKTATDDTDFYLPD